MVQVLALRLWGLLMTTTFHQLKTKLLDLAQRNRPSMSTWVSGQLKLLARADLGELAHEHADLRERYREIVQELERRVYAEEATS